MLFLYFLSINFRVAGDAFINRILFLMPDLSSSNTIFWVWILSHEEKKTDANNGQSVTEKEEYV